MTTENESREAFEAHTVNICRKGGFDPEHELRKNNTGAYREPRIYAAYEGWKAALQWQKARTPQPQPTEEVVERVARAIDPMIKNLEATSEEHQYYVREIAKAATAALTPAEEAKG